MQRPQLQPSREKGTRWGCAGERLAKVKWRCSYGCSLLRALCFADALCPAVVVGSRRGQGDSGHSDAALQFSCTTRLLNRWP